MKLSLPFADKLPRIRQREMPAIGAPVMVLATPCDGGITDTRVPTGYVLHL